MGGLECGSCASGEDGAAEDGKDGKSARAKRSHFGRAVSLKNFILRKGKSASVDAGDAAKEDEEEAAAAAQAADGEGELRGDGKVDVQAAGGETGDDREGEAEAQTTPAHPPVTNGENGCENGTGEDDGRHHRELDDKNNRSPVTKSKELGGAKEETNAKVLNAAAPPVNSGELPHRHRQNRRREGDAHGRPPPPLTNSADEPRGEEEGEQDEDEEEAARKRELRDAAAAIVRRAVSAAADQLERELRRGALNGCRAAC